jgi:hypothetical protein
MRFVRWNCLTEQGSSSCAPRRPPSIVSFSVWLVGWSTPVFKLLNFTFCGTKIYITTGYLSWFRYTVLGQPPKDGSLMRYRKTMHTCTHKLTNKNRILFVALCVCYEWLAMFSVMTLDDGILYFTNAATIRQFLAIFLKDIKTRKGWRIGRIGVWDEIEKKIFPVEFQRVFFWKVIAPKTVSPP